MYGFNNPGGFDPNYWNPQRMQAAQGYGMYDPSMGQPQAPQGADQGNARIDKLKGRIGNLQQQWAGADSGAQAGIQARIDKMQGRVKNLRQDRRQGEGLYAPQAGQQANAGGGGFSGMGGAGWGGMGGYGGMGMGSGGGFSPWGMSGGGYDMGGGYGNRGGWNAGMSPQMGGGYNPMAAMQQQNMGGPAPTGANRPGMQYRQDRRQAQRQGGAPQAGQAPNAGGGNVMLDAQGRNIAGVQMGYSSPSQRAFLNNQGQMVEGGSTFRTKFGDLVQSSVGNANVYKRNGGDDSMLYHYDPNQGWKSMTADAYKGYGDYQYANPADYLDQAGSLWMSGGNTYADRNLANPYAMQATGAWNP